MTRAAAGAVAAIALVGCVGEGEPAPSAVPTPSVETTEAPSSEDVLDEARSTYESYLGAAVAMWAEPDVDYTLLLQWASAEIASQEAAAQEALRAQGVANTGPITIANFAYGDGDGDGVVDAYACLDFRAARYFDADGADVTPPDVIDYAALQVRFERDDNGLVLAGQQALPVAVTDFSCP